MRKKASRKKRQAARRTYSEELKTEVVQMLLDGHIAASVASNLGLTGVTLLYRWKAKLLERSGPAATTLEHRVRELEESLHRRPPLCGGARREREVRVYAATKG